MYPDTTGPEEMRRRLTIWQAAAWAAARAATTAAQAAPCHTCGVALAGKAVEQSVSVPCCSATLWFVLAAAQPCGARSLAVSVSLGLLLCPRQVASIAKESTSTYCRWNTRQQQCITIRLQYCQSCQWYICLAATKSPAAEVLLLIPRSAFNQLLAVRQEAPPRHAFAPAPHHQGRRNTDDALQHEQAALQTNTSPW